jgi:L-threonylcarbamoyladenylate synthase
VMGKCVRMQNNDADIIKIKKLRKDGSISSHIVEKISVSIRNKGIVVLPIDNVYGVIGISEPEVEKRMCRLLKVDETNFVRLISSFKMLNETACYTKFDYDFLNRVWPGEVNVILKYKKSHNGKDKFITIRYPRNKFLQSVIDTVDSPLVVSKACNRNNDLIYRKEDIINNFYNKVKLIVIIEELCKKHPVSTLIDISSGDLKILREGKVTSDEIKSLYFLGKDDDLVY